MLIWIVLSIAIPVTIIALLGYRQVTFPRRASVEGIESPEAARAYDRISRWPQFKLLRRMIVRELRKYHPQGTIADVGCGPGYLVTLLAKSFPQLHVVGVDISEEMTQVATRNLSHLGLGGRAEFRRGDVQDLPFKDNSVDFVLSTLSLHHWRESVPALWEIYRVLSPGGQVLIFDLRRDGRRAFYWLIRFAQKFVVPAAIRRMNEPFGSVLSSYAVDESEALLSASPFREWRVKPGFGWLFLWGRKGG